MNEAWARGTPWRTSRTGSIYRRRHHLSQAHAHTAPQMTTVKPANALMSNRWPNAVKQARA